MTNKNPEKMPLTAAELSELAMKIAKIGGTTESIFLANTETEAELTENAPLPRECIKTLEGKIIGAPKIRWHSTSSVSSNLYASRPHLRHSKYPCTTALEIQTSDFDNKKNNYKIRFNGAPPLERNKKVIVHVLAADEKYLKNTEKYILKKRDLHSAEEAFHIDLLGPKIVVASYYAANHPKYKLIDQRHWNDEEEFRRIFPSVSF